MNPTMQSAVSDHLGDHVMSSDTGHENHMMMMMVRPPGVC